ncbi:LysR substrate-binding domain-containing protein [Magnetospirillum sulfuroxidans]|uniref:LysR family transcriptional regulator n=1 Tax=Magnetospirillum sulfuroxidans TaxID=611300 RepID=A0ABS5IH70_9PROT|nr:LysR substrate-binding domain-containing protein [Magnetospirillum sulfuroxidans]MBR9973542.1 LysR family transcriptional regulator [Magnetospirillum sulfuroxidans]
MISFRQLQCLTAVAETLHFRRAAERLHMSQPALSAQILQLEDHLGVMLVERTRRKVLLTPIGRAVVTRARAVLRDVGELEEIAHQAQAPLSGTLRVGVLRTLGPYLLPHILPELRGSFPELKLYLREEPRERLLAELAQGDLDIVLISAAPDDDNHLTVTPLFHEPLWLTMPLGHRLAARTKLAPADLAGESLIMLEVGDGMRDPALDLCQRSGASEHRDFRATSLDSLRQMVATGLGTTLLPALYVQAEALADDQIAVLSFAVGAPSRPIDMAWRRTTSRFEEFSLFAQLLRRNLPPCVDAR